MPTMDVILLSLFLAFMLVGVAQCALEAFVVGGKETKIAKYPHSVYLDIACESSFICSGSVLNQLVVLTAGHCFEECSMTNYVVNIKYGHEQLWNMRSIRMKDYIVHENYNPFNMKNDVGIVSLVQPFRLSPVVQRVALVPTPTKKFKEGFMAGWGVMNAQDQVSKTLLDAAQMLHSPEICKRLGRLPEGSFCAGCLENSGGPDRGDSGSALIVQNYIQIGLVSYKIKKYSLVVYTNVSYHYNWIKQNAKRLVCRRNIR